jgi:predicted AlkP superfamily pyrophosphatase or phosphodiesterase
MGGPVLVVNVAGLSPRLLGHATRCPNLTRIVSENYYTPVRPVFPAVTCTAQVSLTTGTPASEHGVVANGLYFPELRQTSFWEQSDLLNESERIFTPLRTAGKKVAMLFWQNSIRTDVDVMLTPAPIHTDDGGMILSCYSKPADLGNRLAAEHGPFPLQHYWGPAANATSTEWILKAVEHVLGEYETDLTLVYVPHLDYVLQKEGPSSDAALDELTVVDGWIGRLRQMIESRGGSLVVVSEYGLTEVSGDIALNRVLSAEGFFALRDLGEFDIPDLDACRAFAMADHQMAHIFVRDDADVEAVAELIRRQSGVERVDRPERMPELRIGHDRSGDLIAISDPDKWFSYYWWESEERLPAWVRTVDIHRKPGYDPMEMFIDPETKAIDIRNTDRIRGSHGRLPDDPKDGAVFLSTKTPSSVTEHPWPDMTEVAGWLKGLAE